MRMIGHLEDENAAQCFSDYLYGLDIENQIEQHANGQWQIWVLDEDQIEKAASLWHEFIEDPHHKRYGQGAHLGQTKKKQEQHSQARTHHRIVDARTMFNRPQVSQSLLTITLIVLSVGVTLVTRLGENQSLTKKLQITEYHTDGEYFVWNRQLTEIRQGQIWRIVTPIFLHFGPLHIIFNMLWLRQLGSAIEARKGAWLLGGLILTMAITSNMAQFFISGPRFGGMSGVVFGLLGYIWMQGKFNPSSQLGLEPQTVQFMCFWFVLCLTGLVGPIANTVHAVGAMVGIAWGYLAARYAPRL